MALEKNGTKESCSNYPLPSRHYHLSILLRMIIPNPPLSTNVPTTYAYSNNNFILLGLILEEMWHLPWEMIIQQELFRPLGMTTAGFGSPIEQVPLNSFATQSFGHYKDAAGALHSTDADVPKSWGPAGTVHAGLNDWAKFIACHLQEGRDLTSFGFAPMNSSFLNATTSPYLFSPSVWQTIHTQYIFPLSSTSNSQHSLSGMISNRDNLGLSVWHTGSNTLWYAYAVVYPQLVQPMALLVIVNVANENAVFEAKAAIINAYLQWQHQGQPFPIVKSTAVSYTAFSFNLALILACIHFTY
jgi:CubicO group peptidase (beta-lactamase class C family)